MMKDRTLLLISAFVITMLLVVGLVATIANASKKEMHHRSIFQYPVKHSTDRDSSRMIKMRGAIIWEHSSRMDNKEKRTDDSHSPLPF